VRGVFRVGDIQGLASYGISTLDYSGFRRAYYRYGRRDSCIALI